MASITSGDRCFRGETQYEATEVLEHTAGPGNMRDGCISTGLVRQAFVFVPTLENDTQSVTETEGRQSSQRDSGDSHLADPVLVANASANEPRTVAEITNIEKMVLDRMAIIMKHQEAAGCSSEVQEFLAQEVKNSTARTYDLAWKRWATWCLIQQPPVNPLNPGENRIVAFLQGQNHTSNSNLNVIRSALASVLHLLHPSEVPLVEKP